MRKVAVSLVVMGAALALLGPLPAGGVAKEIIQLQRDVALLQQQMRDLQRSLDEKNAVLKTLVEQSLDAVNRMQLAVKGLEKSVREAQAQTNTQVKSLGTQVQGLRDGVDELRARLGQVSQQLAETQSVLRSLDARAAARPRGAPPEGEAAGSAPVPTSAAPPAADVLYATALRDFTSGQYQLARKEFADYLKHYGRTPLAGNAQFYIGETYYRQADYRRAIAEYDRVLDNHPNSFKTAAAYLKKGYALLELEERDAGLRALRTVMQKFARSEEARMARARLKRLGETLPR